MTLEDSVLVNGDELVEGLRSIRVHGEGNTSMIMDNVRIDLNARLDAIQTAILMEKLSIFSDELEERQKIASITKC